MKLSDCRGKQVLLYFYPKAGTSGYTKQACSVRDSLPRLDDAGLTAMGISPDEPKKQKRFDDKNELGFRLLSDPDHAVADAYGAWWEKSMYGKKYGGHPVVLSYRRKRQNRGCLAQSQARRHCAESNGGLRKLKVEKSWQPGA